MGRKKKKRRVKRRPGGNPARQGTPPLRVIEGGGGPDLRVIEGGSAPLEDRPEYKAHMKAWRAAGCPPGGNMR